MKRSYILIILFLFQVVFLYNINQFISTNYRFFTLLLTNLIAILVSVTILLGNKKLESKIAWTIFVLFVPIVGFLFYMILGVEYSRFKKFDKKLDLDKLVDEKLINEIDKIEDQRQKEVMNVLHKINRHPVGANDDVELLSNGDVKFKVLLEELQKAEKFINFEYFIVKEGYIFNKIKNILINKAKSGVEVRFLYDDFGCVDLSKNIIEELKSAGIKIGCFNKINFKLFRPSINYRNHRKIVVIDNNVGFLGGINIGDEYNHQDDYYGFWRDTHLLIKGVSVSHLNSIFIKDWYHTTEEKLNLTEQLKLNKVQGSGIVQIVSDGPDNNEDIIRNTFFKLITNAKKSISIVTPYLILDRELSIALRIAAMSGIDVKIIVPGIHDKNKKMVYKATEAYFSELLLAGVQIYKYNNRFIHSKILIIDDKMASVGTVNFDYRSFDLHFEVTAILYHTEVIKKIVTEYKEDLTNSTEIIYSNWKRRGISQKVTESLVKVFSPLL